MRRVSGVDPWTGVEIRHLTTLDALERERSFRGAAERLGYVQSAVSQHLAMLEAAVGARLVQRTRGQPGLELTQAGTLLLEHARRILGELSAARADLQALQHTGGNTLRVGAFQSAMTRIMPGVIARLASEHPDLQILTTELLDDAELFASVANGTLDCAFGELPLDRDIVEAVELIIDPCVLLVHAQSPLAKRNDTPTLNEIAALPLAIPNPRLRELFNNWFRVAGLQPGQSFKLETNAAVHALVTAGVAAAIIPKLAADPPPPNTTALPLHDPYPTRTIALYWRQTRIQRPAITKLADTCKTICQEIAEQ
jgi:DNA-binding transcriptional LysR family regulator